jgi:hypothetical protein
MFFCVSVGAVVLMGAIERSVTAVKDIALRWRGAVSLTQPEEVFKATGPADLRIFTMKHKTCVRGIEFGINGLEILFALRVHSHFDVAAPKLVIPAAVDHNDFVKFAFVLKQLAENIALDSVVVFPGVSENGHDRLDHLEETPLFIYFTHSDPFNFAMMESTSSEAPLPCFTPHISCLAE